MADFPDVPDVSGVPPLARDPNSLAPSILDLLTSDTISGYGVGQSPAWGVFKNGQPVIVADSVLTLDFKREWAIADYPVERGGFESYDKVDIPFDNRVRLSSGGSEANRQALLDSIAAIAGDLQLYDVVMPEAIYSSVNVQHYDFRRTASNGLGLLSVDVWLLEVRVTAGNSNGNTQAPSGATQTQDGAVQSSDNVAPTQGSVQSFAAVPFPNVGGLPSTSSPSDLGGSDLLSVQ